MTVSNAMTIVNGAPTPLPPPPLTGGGTCWNPPTPAPAASSRLESSRPWPATIKPSSPCGSAPVGAGTIGPCCFHSACAMILAGSALKKLRPHQTVTLVK